jgi:diacylglycerol kinase (ATP)
LTPELVPVVINPTAGGGRAGALYEALGALGGVALEIADDPAAIGRAARRAVESGRSRILVVGGDGTLHHAIQPLAGSRCALGVVPAGRGNDLARALGLPLDPLAAARRALSIPPRAIDLGRVAGRFFAGVACAGLDGEVARIVRESSVRALGRWAYPLAAARALATFRPPHFRIDHGTAVEAGAGMLVAVANSAFYGGGMRIAPGALLDDGRLDLVFVRRLSPFDLLTALPRLYRGTHLAHPAVVSHRVERVRLSTDRPLTLFGDGEPLAECGADEIEIEVSPGLLSVVA